MATIICIEWYQIAKQIDGEIFPLRNVLKWFPPFGYNYTKYVSKMVEIYKKVVCINITFEHKIQISRKFNKTWMFEVNLK